VLYYCSSYIALLEFVKQFHSVSYNGCIIQYDVNTMEPVALWLFNVFFFCDESNLFV